MPRIPIGEKMLEREKSGKFLRCAEREVVVDEDTEQGSSFVKKRGWEGLLA